MATSKQETPAPTVADLKGLAAQLPPSERLGAADTADVLSALTAYTTHGPGLIDASKQGGSAVADFYHQQAVDSAEASGTEAPVRGNVTSVTPQSPAAQVAGGIDYDALAAAMLKAQEANK